MKDILIAAESGDVRIRELIDSDLVKLSEYADNEKVSINLRRISETIHLERCGEFQKND